MFTVPHLRRRQWISYSKEILQISFKKHYYHWTVGRGFTVILWLSWVLRVCPCEGGGVHTFPHYRVITGVGWGVFMSALQGYHEGIGVFLPSITTFHWLRKFVWPRERPPPPHFTILLLRTWSVFYDVRMRLITSLMSQLCMWLPFMVPDPHPGWAR